MNSKYYPGKLQSRAGTGERLTGTPLVQPSLLHPSQVGVHRCLSLLWLTYKLTLLNNHTVYIYIVQFIAIKFNSWVLHSL